MKNLMCLVILVFAIGFGNAQEFPICTSNNDQLYPDVAFDGTNFWTVWADKRNGESQIYGARITPQGTVLDDSGILLASYPDADYIKPSIIFRDTIGCIVFDIVSPPETLWGFFNNIGISTFNLNGEIMDSFPKFLTGHWGPPYEWWYGDKPTVMLGKESFFIFLEEASFCQIEGWRGVLVKRLKADSLSTIATIYDNMPSDYANDIQGIWDGEKLFVTWNNLDSSWMNYNTKGAFLKDSAYLYDDSSNSFVVRDNYHLSDYYGLAYGNGCFLLISGAGEIWYDILSDSGKPIDSLPHIIDNGDSIHQQMPTCTYLKNNFIAVWQDVIGSNSNLYGIMLDTLGNIIDSGYINWSTFKKQQPSIATDGNKTLLVWADNRNGNFDIYGRIMDSLAVEESSPRPSLPAARFSVFPNPFFSSTTIQFSVSRRDFQVPISLEIFDISGKLVNSINSTNSINSIPIGKNLNPGVYFIKINNSTPIKIIKMGVLK